MATKQAMLVKRWRRATSGSVVTMPTDAIFENQADHRRRIGAP
jgi:hypothetical protein